MSASDALSAVRTVYQIATKVRDNREELLRVSRRIEYIVVSLEETRTRDAIQTDEYNDALTIVSDMILRTQRVAQRLLKRSIGDRTWNAAEIAGEIRRLNEDVQNYLSVHAIRALDIIQASHAQQFSVISNNLEEIMAKIAEMDFRFSTRPGDPWPLDIQSVALGNLFKTPSTLPGLDLTEDIQAGKLPLDEDGFAVRSLVATRNTSINIAGLKKDHGGGCKTVTLQVKSNASHQDIIRAIKDAGYIPPDKLYEDSRIKITVTSQESVYDATAPGGLQISRSEPLLWWWNKYTAYHGLERANTPGQSSVDLSLDGRAITAAGTTFVFHRTFRVPDAVTNNLPPNLGLFPLFPVTIFADRLPESVRQKGGFLMPMFRREALWISFQAHEHTAVKVSVGGVNAISGHAKDAMTPPDTVQDYIIAGLQPWLDGVATEPGIVRQFVATVLGQGYTVEEQVTGHAELGGLQFDIFPKRSSPEGTFTLLNNKGQSGATLDNVKTATELGITEGLEIYFISGSANSSSYRDSWNLSDYRRRASPSAVLSAIYVYSDGRRRVHKNGLGRLRSEAAPRRLGISAGGKISQKIYRDPDSPRIYDEEHGHRFHIHIISPEHWEEITGILPPITPITRDMYLKHNLPWYTLYDNYIEGLDTTSEALSKIRSVAEMDRDHTPTATHESPGSVHPEPVDPSNPPGCSRHPQRLSSAVFRPCGHVACEACLGTALLTGSKCTSCGVHVEKLVGMTRAIPGLTRSVSPGDGGSEEGGDPEWRVESMEELAMTVVKNAGRIFTIHLQEDRVAPLHRAITPC